MLRASAANSVRPIWFANSPEFGDRWVSWSLIPTSARTGSNRKAGPTASSARPTCSYAPRPLARAKATSVEGIAAAGALLARILDRGADIRRLAFSLYTLCERKGWAEDARRYNKLVTARHGIEAAAHDAGPVHYPPTLDL